MSNSTAWDNIAARRSAASDTGVVSYGRDLPTDADLRLCGDVSGKRVLDLGCGSGENAIAIALQGAHVIAVDASTGQLQLARKLADAAEIRVEWHQGDAADLAFLRADSIDLAIAVGLLGEVDDVDRLLRQVQRVLRPGGAFVFSIDHPVALALGRDNAAPGALPLGNYELRRSYFDAQPTTVIRAGERIDIYPRTMADIFASLHRAGFRLDVLLEPEPVRTADPGPQVPPIVIWRARKEGV
jgi:ubiquinone/menaquinone biosynthesis C-methylase UbiE